MSESGGVVPGASGREHDDFKALTQREQALVAGWEAEVARLRAERDEAHACSHTLTSWPHTTCPTCKGTGRASSPEPGDRFEQMPPYGSATLTVERRIDDAHVAVVRDTGARQVFPASTLLNERYWRRASSPEPESEGRCKACGHLLTSHALNSKGPCMVGCGCKAGDRP